MFADPISFLGVSFPCISRGPDESKYQHDDGLGTVSTITVGHQFRKERNRFVIRLDVDKVTNDPFNSERSIPVRSSMYFVIDKPVIGQSAGEALIFAGKLPTFLLASEQTALVKMLGGET